MTSDLKLIPNDFEASKELFLIEKEKLENTLCDFVIQVEHIGSTALPGSLGKGIIDVLLICTSPEEQLPIRDTLVANGYIQGELNKVPDGRLFFVSIPDKTEAGDLHLHVVVKDSKNLESLLFRNYLLTHPEEIDKYNEEKQRLAHLTHRDRYEYAVKKAMYIEAMMKKFE